MFNSCQFNPSAGQLTTPQNPVAQNSTNPNHFGTLPVEIFQMILSCIGVPHHIGEIFKCRLVCSTWQKQIENHPHIFKIVCESLNLKNVQKEQEKSTIINTILALKETSKKGEQELKTLTEKLPTFKDYEDLGTSSDEELDEEHKRDKKEKKALLNTVKEGLKADILLLNVGQRTWDDIKKYLDFLPNLSKKNEFVLPKSLYETIFDALCVAAKLSRFDDVLTFNKHINWNGYLPINKFHNLLYPIYLNVPFEEAQELVNTIIRDFQIDSWGVPDIVYKLCELFHECNEVDKARVIAQTLLQPIEERALKKALTEEASKFDTDPLHNILKSYLLSGEIQKVYEYLTKYPQFAYELLTDQINESCKLSLAEFVHQGSIKTLYYLEDKVSKSVSDKGSLDNPLDHEDDILDLERVSAGLAGALILLEHKQIGWDVLEKYIPTLIASSQFVKKFGHLHMVLIQTVKVELNHHLIEDAKNICLNTNWNRKLTAHHHLVEYLCMNENVEQAEQFIISNLEIDFVQFLFGALNSWLENNSDKAKTAFSNMTQFLEKKFIELTTLDTLTSKELHRLRCLLCIFSHHEDETKIQDFLSKRPDLLVPLSNITLEFLRGILQNNYPSTIACRALQFILETHIQLKRIINTEG